MQYVKQFKNKHLYPIGEMHLKHCFDIQHVNIVSNMSQTVPSQTLSRNCFKHVSISVRNKCLNSVKPFRVNSTTSQTASNIVSTMSQTVGKHISNMFQTNAQQ